MSQDKLYLELAMWIAWPGLQSRTPSDIGADADSMAKHK